MLEDKRVAAAACPTGGGVSDRHQAHSYPAIRGRRRGMLTSLILSMVTAGYLHGLEGIWIDRREGKQRLSLSENQDD